MIGKRQIFCSSQPGDTIEKLGKFCGGAQRLIEYNPHLRNKSRLIPGELVFLPDLNSPRPDSYWNQNIQEMSRVWNAVPPRLREFIFKNFDVLDFFSDVGDFGYQFSGKSVEFAAKFPKYVASIEEASLILTRIVSEELTLVRRQTFATLQRLNISFTTMKVFLVQYELSGFYSLARRLERIIALADEISFAKKLILIDVGLQVGKIGVVIGTGGTSKEVLKQTVKSTGNLIGGAGAMAIATGICTVTLAYPVAGWAVCGVAVGAAAFYGSSVGERAAEIIASKVISGY